MQVHATPPDIVVEFTVEHLPKAHQISINSLIPTVCASIYDAAFRRQENKSCFLLIGFRGKQWTLLDISVKSREMKLSKKILKS